MKIGYKYNIGVNYNCNAVSVIKIAVYFQKINAVITLPNFMPPEFQSRFWRVSVSFGFMQDTLLSICT